MVRGAGQEAGFRTNPEQRLLRLRINGHVYEATTNNRPLLGSSLVVSRCCHTLEAVRQFPQVCVPPCVGFAGVRGASPHGVYESIRILVKDYDNRTQRQ